jgi:hypothetical protein
MLSTIHPNTNSETAQQDAAEPVLSAQVADFRLNRLEAGGWKLHVVTTRASYWLHANHTHLCETDFTFDLEGANAFLRSARKDGLKTEYIGPVGRAIL